MSSKGGVDLELATLLGITGGRGAKCAPLTGRIKRGGQGGMLGVLAPTWNGVRKTPVNAGGSLQVGCSRHGSKAPPKLRAHLINKWTKWTWLLGEFGIFSRRFFRGSSVRRSDASTLHRIFKIFFEGKKIMRRPEKKSPPKKIILN